MEMMPEELRQLKRFHGHLGPYVVVGYRMGSIARQRMEGRLWAISFTGTQVPLSCIVDGIQFSSSCTLGKGNISIQDKREAKAHFVNEKQLLEIKLLDEVREHIDASMSHETEELMAIGLFNEPEEAIFSIIVVESLSRERKVKLK
ncbi:MAG: formylmethanofuran dehydrogenase subunit E family protein [Methanomassiliicoccales archaeon]|nr:formylmethanofuran dehydrogenase subunit E family protein [Methanomassiliicoccales archaeon]